MSDRQTIAAQLQCMKRYYQRLSLRMAITEEEAARLWIRRNARRWRQRRISATAASTARAPHG